MDGRPHLFHYLPLPPRLLHRYQVILLGDGGTWVWTTCPELLPDTTSRSWIWCPNHYLIAARPGIELTTSQSWIRRTNHYATKPPYAEWDELNNEMKMVMPMCLCVRAAGKHSVGRERPRAHLGPRPGLWLSPQETSRQRVSLSRHTGWGQLPLSLKAKVSAEHVKSVAHLRL